MSELPPGFTLEHPSADSNVGLLRIDAGKANAMSPEFLAALGTTMTTLRDEQLDALVLTGAGRAFSAGLALPLIVDFDRDRLRAFMQSFAASMESVLTFPIPTVAAVNGHAIAGGCVLALMCDVRLMAFGAGRIGLNEVAIGIGLPASVVEPLRVRVPARSYAPIAFSGQLFSPDDALALDLLDDVVSPDELESTALTRAASYANAPAATAQVKAALLRPVLQELRAHEDAELEAWLDTWFSVAGQRAIRGAVASLRR